MSVVFSRRALVAVVAVIVVGIAGLSTVVLGRGRGPEYFTAEVGRGDIRNVVTATGTVEAVVTVNIGSQVSGQIQGIYADYNSTVKQGQLLAKIDPRPFEAQLANAESSLAAAEAHVRTATADVADQKASLTSAQANLDAARAARESAVVTLRRDQQLLDRQLLDRSDFDTAKADADEAVAKYNAAEASLEQARTTINASAADLSQARAQAAQARAAVRSSQLNLSFTNIVSPVDGVVISRNVDVGQTVAASLQAPLLFVIANNLGQMQVNASVDEADIGHLSVNAPVTFTVDAYPSDTFSGRITEIRLNPQTVQNVVTYSVIIGVDNRQLKLRPGMTANVSIQVATADDVLKVPNAALRYEPTGVTRQKLQALLGPVTAGGAGRAPAPAAATGGPAPAPPEAWPLAPGEHWDPAAKVQFPAPAPPRPRPAIVWKLENGRPVPERVVVGITDGVSTALVAGPLHAGDRLVIADTSQATAGQPASRGGGAFRFGR